MPGALASVSNGHLHFRSGICLLKGAWTVATTSLALVDIDQAEHNRRCEGFNIGARDLTDKPRSADVLSDLPSELANALFSKARLVVLKAEHTLFIEGNEGDGCYRVEEGLLKASVKAPNGNERILAIFGPGAVIGELAMIDGGVRSASVTALRDSKLSFVSRATFEAVAQDTPELSRHLLIVVTRRLRDTNNALTATNFLSVKGRVASALLQLAEAFGRDVGSGRILIEQKVSQNELAAMAGIARENVTRVLTDWTNRSWLSRLAGYYCLENKKAIRGEAGVASTSGTQ